MADGIADDVADTIYKGMNMQAGKGARLRAPAPPVFFVRPAAAPPWYVVSATYRMCYMYRMWRMYRM